MELIIILIIILLPTIAQIKVKTNYSKYSKRPNSINMTGKQVAEKILQTNGLTNVRILETDGTLTDHYDPTNKVIRLSKNIYNDTSISAAAVAAHEVGHAIQDKEAYSFLTLRTKLVPVVNFSSRISSIVIAISFIIESTGLLDIAIGLLFISLLFQLITLPVEFNASKRAKEQLNHCGMITNNDNKGIKKVLSAAALTYVAGFLASALDIIRLIIISNNRKN